MLGVRRKILQVGGSLVLVLPKVWTDAKGLKPHDLVEILLSDDLTIKPIKAGDRPNEDG